MKRLLPIGYLLLVTVVSMPLHGSGDNADAAITLSFKTGAVVQATTYTLGDVADIETDVEQRRQLQGLPLGLAPRPGQQAHVRRIDVDRQIARHFPALVASLRWRGETRTRIRATGVPYATAAAVQQAQTHLEDWLRPRFPTAVVTPVRAQTQSLLVPAGALEVRPRLSTAVRLAQRICVWVDIFVDANRFQTLPVWFAVQAPAPVLTARRGLPARHTPTAGDLRAEVIDLATLRGQPLVPAALPALRLKRALQKGSVLLQDHLEPVPAVSRGQLITVYARQGSVAIKVQGKARADGHIAESIAVENPASGASYNAVVIDKGIARVN
ncbi:flagellar basal body P-ring formation protein FlgA [Exilibacterium tricleocarpae]|uniref:Flagella basal body P-ring formation protein FlgA n=1 Tax=Exilibacterium tricleocarpae TaxID=2591008 RepID=A0A545T853_9GAMM|nr:flagellar basal body P-ring formation chaperone FlgA [Exilibacterium tricleocarpae]TQV73404.1 flagellar basal body P-ring formation protein FlgA [Exilibacterium tricleocarpae]